MNPKLVSSILSNLKSIKWQSFDERVIKNLLIEIRDCGLQKSGVLKEICHFIAHPTLRDQGICLKEIDILYFQLKYWNLLPHKSVKFEIEKIPKKEFCVLMDTINKVPAEYLDEINLDCKKALSIVESSYKNRGKSIKVISKSKNIKKIIAILNCVIRVVIPSGVFSQCDLIDEFAGAIEDILAKNAIDNIFNDSIYHNQNDLMLCILSLLQGAKFRLYDDTLADSKISIGNINDVIENGVEPTTVNYNGVFKVPYMDDAFSVGIVLTEIPFLEYFNENNFDIKTHTCPIFNVKRNGENRLEVCSLQQTKDY